MKLLLLILAFLLVAILTRFAGADLRSPPPANYPVCLHTNQPSAKHE